MYAYTHSQLTESLYHARSLEGAPAQPPRLLGRLGVWEFG